MFPAETKTDAATADDRAATVADRAVTDVAVVGKWATDDVAVGVGPRRSGPERRCWREPAGWTTAPRPVLCRPNSSSPKNGMSNFNLSQPN